MIVVLFCSFSDLSDRHREVMGAVKSQLESSHQEELNELTASFLADSAIKVESARLETEHEWQEKLDSVKKKHKEDVQALTEKLSQVSRNLMFSESKYSRIYLCDHLS